MKNPAVILNLKNLKSNLDLVRKQAGDAEILAVVKSNGYGHGLEGMSSFLSQMGIRRFVVGTLSEGQRLREGGIAGKILILGATPPEWAAELSELDLTQSVFCEEYAEELARFARHLSVKIKIQIKTDTGMHRLGFDWFNTVEIVHCCSTTVFEVEGIFSHFGSADGKSGEAELRTRLQGERFFNCLSELDKLGFERGIAHCCNSAALFRYPQYKCDAVRVGAALYGIGGGDKALKPVLSLRAPLLQVKSVEKSDFVGYGLRRLETTAKLGIVGVGYGHGISGRLSDRGVVWINGQRCPIVGRICMDFLTVDLTGTDAHPGDDAWIVGGGISAATVAKSSGTIDYETVTCLADKTERIYVW